MPTTEMKNSSPARAKEFFQDKMSFTTGPVELDRMIKTREDIVIIDVRDAADFAKGHIPDAINLPKDRWSTFQGLTRSGVNIVCHLAATACVDFAEEGFRVMELDGGFEDWQKRGMEITQ